MLEIQKPPGDSAAAGTNLDPLVTWRSPITTFQWKGHVNSPSKTGHKLSCCIPSKLLSSMGGSAPRLKGERTHPSNKTPNTMWNIKPRIEHGSKIPPWKRWSGVLFFMIFLDNNLGLSGYLVLDGFLSSTCSQIFSLNIAPRWIPLDVSKGFNS